MTSIGEPKPNLIRTSKNRMKLGVFGTNGPGAAFTFHPDRFKPTWDANLRLAQRADALGLEAFVSAAHWKAFGGDGHYTGDMWETFTWAGAIAAVTERIAIVSTIHMTLIPAIFAAKAEATVDLISNGRCGLNLVCGWYPEEQELFGLKLREHGDRYDYGDEWLQLFDRFWSETKSFDFDGQYFHLKNAMSQPRGVQERPVLFNAGGSPRGQEFAGKNCDIAFILAQNPDPAVIKVQVEQYRNMAREKYGKEIQVWIASYVVVRDTTEEAKAYAHDFIVTHGDDKAVEEVIRINIPNAKTLPDGAIAHMAYALKAGWGGYPLVGTAEEVTNMMAALSDAGIDGMLLTWLDYDDGLDRLAKEVLPRLEKAGLRLPASTQ